MNRREMLGSLGVASASSLLWAFGCSSAQQTPTIRAPEQITADVRSWLRDAVSRLAAIYPSVHALAVSRNRTTAALDVLGIGVARARRDGVVFTVREANGPWREHTTTDLSQEGVLAAVSALIGWSVKRAPLEFPDVPARKPAPRAVDERELKNRLGAIMRSDLTKSSRIVYAAAMIDIDDITVWSIAPGHDHHQQLRRVRNRATRAAWSGSRPVVSEVEHGWTGDHGDKAHQLTEAEVTVASERALLQLTPGQFSEGEATVVLEPSVTATVIDAAVRGLLTTTALRRPEVAKRVNAGAVVARDLTLVDDPTAPDAYGGFEFDDEGEPAQPITLLAAGHVAGRIADREAVAAKLATVAGRGRRAGHLGKLEPAPSHLRLAPGTLTRKQLVTDGWLLEGRLGTAYDPSSDQVIVRVARARELKNGSDTGRVYADVEIVGELAKLLAGVDGVAAESETTALREEINGEPRWRSIAAPWLRTRGLVRSSRGAR